VFFAHSLPGLFVCSVAGPGVGMPGEPVVIVGNPEHDRLSRALFRRSSKGTHFLNPLPPMIWVIGQHARRRWGCVISHHLEWYPTRKALGTLAAPRQTAAVGGGGWAFAFPHGTTLRAVQSSDTCGSKLFRLYYFPEVQMRMHYGLDDTRFG
jgi:hypothetical protein